MKAASPEQVDVLFERALNAGDLDALVALYEPAAALVPQPGTTVYGSAAIREALAGFLAMKPRIALAARVLAQSNEIALVASEWKLTGMGQDGQPVSMTGRGAEVMRRQRDGTWLFVVDDPWGGQAGS